MKIQSPWMGRIKGSAGNMTGCKVYDKNVMRAKAFEVSNPKTASQTTQRDFFAQLSEAVASVTDEQLRSLYPQKPKGMSRRNALAKELAKMANMDGSQKILDGTLFQGIGNGPKVSVPMVKIVNDSGIGSERWSQDLYPRDKNNQIAYVCVMFDTDNNKLVLRGYTEHYEQGKFYEADDFPGMGVSNGYGYMAPVVGGADVYLRGFGSFIIKTRAEK